MIIKNQVTVTFNGPEDLMFLKSILWLAERGLSNFKASHPDDIFKDSGYTLEFSQKDILKKINKALLVVCNRQERVNI
jgi:hypothetical protein